MAFSYIIIIIYQGFLQKKKYHYLQLKANSDITTDGEK